MKRIWMVVAVAALAGSLGYMLGSKPARPVAVEPQPRSLEVITRTVAERPQGFDESFWRELRAVVREELRSAPGPSQEPREAKKEQQPTQQNLDAYQQATSLVSSALAARRWSQEDGARLRALTGQLTQSQYLEVMHTLVPAINNQQLTVEGRLL